LPGAEVLPHAAIFVDEQLRDAAQLAGLAGLAVFVISYGYSRIIEHFSRGGGGYVVASKHLGGHVGLVSGSALLVDYVLTIANARAVAGAGAGAAAQVP
jgi:hypothetical protein